MTFLLRLSNASFGYAGRAVVAGVDLEVGPGDFMGVVGPNGSGKSTLLRGMLGLLEPLAGAIDRRDVVVGYVPQRESLDGNFPLTVYEVVAMGAGARLRPLERLLAPARALRQECEAALRRVGMHERRRSSFADLSGGQRQRVLLARALMVRPNLLLLDEPTSGVDRAAEERILTLLHELAREGLGILLVSHQLDLVRQTVDRVLLVSGGRVLLAAPEELAKPERMAELFGPAQGAGAEA